MTVRILTGDCRDILKTLPDESVHMVCTSPPYWGLRDYGVDGQIGLEASVAEHITILRDVFREVRRVLRADGTCWVNYGDAYAGGGKGGNPPDSPHQKQATNKGSLLHAGLHEAARQAGAVDRSWQKPPAGLKAKDLIGLPWRLAFALQDDGWWLRSDIIWAKPNPMPESCQDRPTRAHEYVFLLSKSPRYWYDADAIRTEIKAETTKMPDGWDTGPGAHGSMHRNGREKGRKLTGGDHSRHSLGEAIPLKERRDKQRGHGRRHDGFNDRWDGMTKEEEQAAGANARSVWTIATSAFPEAHFATFPPELAERCIKAGCPEGGTVLDPFGGAGTTGMVADRLQRNAVLIELNPAYAEIARNRIFKDAGMFAEIAS